LVPCLLSLPFYPWFSIDVRTVRQKQNVKAFVAPIIGDGLLESASIGLHLPDPLSLLCQTAANNLAAPGAEGALLMFGHRSR